MNISDAIKSGKPIRRKGKAAHCGSNGTGYVDIRMLIGCCYHACQSSFHLSVADLTANDWEVYPDSEDAVEKDDSNYCGAV